MDAVLLLTNVLLIKGQLESCFFVLVWICSPSVRVIFAVHSVDFAPIIIKFLL